MPSHTLLEPPLLEFGSFTLAVNSLNSVISSATWRGAAPAEGWGNSQLPRGQSSYFQKPGWPEKAEQSSCAALSSPLRALSSDLAGGSGMAREGRW